MQKTPRKQREALAIQLYAKHVGRKARKGGLDPNDRGCDRNVARKTRKMRPERVDELLRDAD